MTLQGAGGRAFRWRSRVNGTRSALVVVAGRLASFVSLGGACVSCLHLSPIQNRTIFGVGSYSPNCASNNDDVSPPSRHVLLDVDWHRRAPCSAVISDCPSEAPTGRESRWPIATTIFVGVFSPRTSMSCWLWHWIWPWLCHFASRPSLNAERA